MLEKNKMSGDLEQQARACKSFDELKDVVIRIATEVENKKR